MLSSTASVAPKQTTPSALPSGNGTIPSNGQSFAQLLNEQPTTPPPAQAEPAPTKPEAPPEQDAPPAPDGPTDSTRLNRLRELTKKPVAPIKVGPETTASDTAKAKAAANRKEAEATMTAAKTAAIDTDKPDDAPETSELTDLAKLIGLATPAPAAGATDGVVMPVTTPACVLQQQAEHSAPDAPGDEATETNTGRAARAIDTSLPTERRAEAPQRGKPAETPADKSASRAAIASPTDALQTAQAQAPAAAAPQTAAAAPGVAAPNFSAVLAQALPPSAAPADVAPATAYGQVRAAVHSSAFGPELGARVSLLAADGLQTAELQLNPTDMGPVSVQIVVDGSQAQVSFHALHAETRQVLEQSLPDLAAALQAQGLTLSGGGVFQQAQRDAQSSGNEDSSDRPARTGGVGPGGRLGATGPVSAPVRRTVGLLDTFA